MESAIVTFQEKGTNKKIELLFDYDKESSNLDYDIKFTNITGEDPMTFIGFLAKMFLTSLELNKK